MKKRPRLYLVGSDPRDVFNDLDKLRTESATPIPRRRATETFARIPHGKGLLLAKSIGSPALAVLIELDRLVLKNGGQNPVRLWSAALTKAGVTYQTRARALRQLTAAGVIRVEKRGRGLSPWVTHLWYSREE
jgi:hypothetical protein